MKLPPRRYGGLTKKKSSESTLAKMKRMRVGDYIIFPRSEEGQLRIHAIRAGIRIAQRRMGTKDKIYVWRIA